MQRNRKINEEEEKEYEPVEEKKRNEMREKEGMTSLNRPVFETFGWLCTLTLLRN